MSNFNKTKNTVGPGQLFEHLGNGLKNAASLVAQLDLTADKAQVQAKGNSFSGSANHEHSGDSGAGPDYNKLLENIVMLSSQLLPSKKLSADEDFFNKGGDSVNAVELVSRLSEELGVKMTLDDIFADARPRRIAERWLQRQGIAIPREPEPMNVQSSQSSPILNTTSVDTSPTVKSRAFEALSDQLQQTQKEDMALIQQDLTKGESLPWLEAPNDKIPKRVLLTGATGFLGSHVLFDLLRHSEVHVVCLVRAADDQAAEERLAEELAKREFVWSSELKRRITVVCGDLQEECLGWSEEQWDAQSECLDGIVNVAAAVDFVRGYASLRDMNVLGVLTLADLAASKKIKPLHQVSSLAVFDEYNIDAIGENEPPARLDRLFSGYDKTKWVTEALLKRARERGFCVTLLRPGGINGNTQTGVYNASDLSSGFIAAFQSMRLLPEFKFLNAAPVDWISRIIADIVIDPEAWGRNYHLIGEPIPLKKQVQDTALSGMAVKVVRFDQWREAFFKRMSEDPIPQLDFMVRALQSEATIKLMEAVFTWPAATADNVDALVVRRELPARPKNDGADQIQTLERLVRNKRATLPGKDDTPYLQFFETMDGHLSGMTTPSLTEPCHFSFQIAVASFFQLFRGRRLDVYGSVECTLLHPRPLRVTSGDMWLRPHEGVPQKHSLTHPLIKYRIELEADDQSEWWIEGQKTTSPGFNKLKEGTTLYISVGRKNQPAEFRGTMKVPLDTYIKDQIEGISINPSVPLHEQYAAKVIWLAWFNGQLTLGYLNPLLRVAGGLIDSFQTYKNS